MEDLHVIHVAAVNLVRCVEGLNVPEVYRGTSRLYLCALRPGTSGVDVPYIDINPHRGRPKWWSYAALGLLLVLTTAVVGAALV
jgi:hypothetical protein